MYDKEYWKKYRQEHKESILASQKKWKANHPDKVKEHNSAWRKAHPEKVKEYNHKQYMRRKYSDLESQKQK